MSLLCNKLWGSKLKKMVCLALWLVVPATPRPILTNEVLVRTYHFVFGFHSHFPLFAGTKSRENSTTIVEGLSELVSRRSPRSLLSSLHKFEAAITASFKSIHYTSLFRSFRSAESIFHVCCERLRWRYFIVSCALTRPNSILFWKARHTNISNFVFLA